MLIPCLNKVPQTTESRIGIRPYALIERPSTRLLTDSGSPNILSRIHGLYSWTDAIAEARVQFIENDFWAFVAVLGGCLTTVREDTSRSEL